MPYHRIPKSSIHEDVFQIQREGEEIVAVAVDATDFHVFTKYPIAKSTHQARLGIEQRAEWDAFITDDIVRLPGGDVA